MQYLLEELVLGAPGQRAELRVLKCTRGRRASPCPGLPEEERLTLLKLGCSNLQGGCLDRSGSPNTVFSPLFVLWGLVWGSI